MQVRILYRFWGRFGLLFVLILVPFGALFGGLGALLGPFGRPLGPFCALLGCFGYLFDPLGLVFMVLVV